MVKQEKREKVVRGLQCLATQRGYIHYCSTDNCPYKDLHTCSGSISRDVLALLKEQEPVEPIQDMVGDALFWVCGKCGHDISSSDWYCPNCGRAVKWE